MEALTELSKSLGVYDKWCVVRKRYQLHWINGDESIKAMARFFNPTLTVDSMLRRIKEMIANTPILVTQIIKFACLVS